MGSSAIDRKSGSNRLDALTALRFFAAFAVFGSHLHFLGETQNTVLKLIYQKILWEGYIGVTFFFILSGFILSYSYKPRLFKSINLTSFYLGRFARIYPLHLLTLLLAIPFFVMVDALPSLSVIGLNASLLQGFLPSREIHFSLNLPAWSLSAEIFFYALFPLLVGFSLPKLFVLGLACLAWQGYELFSNNFNQSSHFWIYIFPVSRLLDFIVGIFLFRLHEAKAFKIEVKMATLLQVLSFLMLAIFFAGKGFVAQAFRWDLYYLLPMSFVIFAFSLSEGYLAKILSCRFLVLLGEVSFAFYLTHFLIIQYSKKLFSEQLGEWGIIAEMLFVLSLFFVTLIVSWLLFQFYEKPVRRFVKKLNQS